MTIASLVLAILQTINLLMKYVNTEQAKQSGVDAQIAKTSQAILAKTVAGKAIMEKVNALSSSDVDAALRDLEPK